VVLAATACGAGSVDDGDGKDADSGTTSGEGEDEDEPEEDGLRPLAEVSGACPELSSSGFVTFDSFDQERSASIVVPSVPGPDMPLVFFFHGLMDPGSTPEPTEYMVNGLGLQSLADTHNAVIVVPEAPIYSLLGFSFFLWDIALETDADLVLFDDLRTCVAEQLDVDLARTTAWGFSGGALWTTVMAAQRGDAFAAIVEASGGSDISVPIWPDLAAKYETPAYTMPALLISGGASDIWPSASLTLVDFEAATDTLEAQLAEDGHTVVSCHHSSGHSLPNPAYYLSIDWVMEHRFGEVSPWAGGDLGGDDSWCELVNAGG
jgi:predicted esterase